ncbi:glutamine--fructose-6-phosphate transaminase (isomerizing) [Methylonatrum kenyense]|uniref:glutamine--fructose-6-phosphate transaminase (isomerizing) n=1 Tax=Methylonatrum kenyense TaxID=455253 RepID=UPI0020BE52DF|nr:glutamine--fructose-6-phosphate transaminase (isomerizing) [Methylonatrum kenyense]MCK8515237.1 glutamine--fructose-6-phosphate transaminase (isomerizing) [Methylonatrum kenyense]
MCGIVGAVAQRDVKRILLEGLRRLEYRGYDSAGLAVLAAGGPIQRHRAVGKVEALENQIAEVPLSGHTGIAHTRWATHGVPSECNAHPHISRDRIALVHNGIIENYQALKQQLQVDGYSFSSDTDSEVVVNLVHQALDDGGDLLAAVRKVLGQIRGAYALAVMDRHAPGRLIGARRGSPLVVGLGFDEYFFASDVFALLPVTQRFVFLEEGDVVDLRAEGFTILNAAGEVTERPIQVSGIDPESADRGAYRHYMLKEIHEQPAVIANTLSGRLADGRLSADFFGGEGNAILERIKRVQIVACGTSYHAGMVARYWIEELCGLPCNVEVASEYRYRVRPVADETTLFVVISQSGETADTLAALRDARERDYGASLAICNVPESSLVRESDLVLMTRAGQEIGVASTKAFTTQLVALMLLVLALGRHRGLPEAEERRLAAALQQLPQAVEACLALEGDIQAMAEHFADKHHALFLGRGAQYPVAMEGALKLKEISYIHAEAYPAGELKHGPLALVDADMPVVAVAPNNELLEKLLSNLQEVNARGGELFVFADQTVEVGEVQHHLPVVSVDDELAPLIYTVPLQLLAYHVAVLKGTDVDKPRNLAKSVTVE